MAWLAWHCVQRGKPLREGQLITSGSCTGFVFAPPGAHVKGELAGIGSVEVEY